jgi:hypothetical protein
VPCPRTNLGAHLEKSDGAQRSRDKLQPVILLGFVLHTDRYVRARGEPAPMHGHARDRIALENSAQSKDFFQIDVAFNKH